MLRETKCHVMSPSRLKLLCCVLVSQFDAMDSNGLVIPISLWMKKLTSDDNPRCLVVMEPVERTSATFSFDSKVGALFNSLHFWNGRKRVHFPDPMPTCG